MRIESVERRVTTHQTRRPPTGGRSSAPGRGLRRNASFLWANRAPHPPPVKCSTLFTGLFTTVLTCDECTVRGVLKLPSAAAASPVASLSAHDPQMARLGPASGPSKQIRASEPTAHRKASTRQPAAPHAPQRPAPATTTTHAARARPTSRSATARAVARAAVRDADLEAPWRTSSSVRRPAIDLCVAGRHARRARCDSQQGRLGRRGMSRRVRDSRGSPRHDAPCTLGGRAAATDQPGDGWRRGASERRRRCTLFKWFVDRARVSSGEPRESAVAGWGGARHGPGATAGARLGRPGTSDRPWTGGGRAQKTRKKRRGGAKMSSRGIIGCELFPRNHVSGFKWGCED